MLSNMYYMIHRILQREGANVSLVQQGSGGTYNPATGEYSVSTPVTTTVKAAFIDYSNVTNGLTTHMNTIVESGDKQAYIDGHTLPSKISPAGDTIIVGTTVWRVMSVREYNLSGSFSILYDLLLRR